MRPGRGDDDDADAGMSVSFTETGAFDFARSRGMVSAQYPVGITEIFIPPKAYIKIPGSVGVPLPRGKSWIAVDAGISGGPVSSLLGPFGGGTDPADLLASLTAISSSVTNLGTTTIRGVPVTGFRGEYRPGEGGRPGPALGACGLSMVATQLPEPATKDNKPAGWVIAPPFGFVTVTTVGGGEDELLPAKRPVMQVDCWSTRPGSNKPPWERANRLAEHISAATRDRHRVPRPLAISSRGVVYPSASVQRAALMTRPGRIWDDAGDMARYQFDLQLQWITLAEMLG